MVGYEPDKPNFSRIDQMIVGGSSAMASRFIVQPLDVLKIRFQVIFYFVINCKSILTWWNLFA